MPPPGDRSRRHGHHRRRWGGRPRWPEATGLITALLSTVGCGTNDVAAPAPNAPELLASAAAGNQHNVLSAVVTARIRFADSVAVRYGLAGGALDSVTAAVTVEADSAVVPVLGLLAKSTYLLRLEVYGGKQTLLGDSLRYSTGALPADLPRYTTSGALAVTVVVGRDTPQYDRLAALCAAHPGWQLLDRTDGMAGLMAAADLALGTTGVTTWERCCLGLPAVTVTSADNQEPIAAAMADARLLVHLGAVEAVSAAQIADAVRGLRAAPALTRAMADAGRALVDGRGAQRVARRLLGGAIHLRRAQPDDCLPVFEWRNDERTRRYALDPAPLAWEAHRTWFDRMLANAAHVLLIGEDDSGPLGVLRYDLAGGEARVSVYLVPGRQGEGRGSSLIAAGSRWLAAHYAAVQRVTAEILPENRASVLAFSEAGFQLRHTVYVTTLTPDPL